MRGPPLPAERVRARNPDHSMYLHRFHRYVARQWTCDRTFKNWYTPPHETPSFCPYCGDDIVVEER